MFAVSFNQRPIISFIPPFTECPRNVDGGILDGGIEFSVKFVVELVVSW